MPAITRRSGQQAGSTPHDSAKPPTKLTPDKPEPNSPGSQESSVGQSELPAPASERRLRAQTKTRTKDKHVYGERGGLRMIMKMPLEVFTEIARHLCPGDLITLIRSTKLFRNIFLRRSAANVWECARKNVPRLPPCPFAMCEPQYAALLFSKHCTLCGGFAKAKPDPYLFVRLCPTCRESKLIDRADIISHHKLGLDGGLFVSSNVIRPKNKANVKFMYSTGEYCLIDEVDEALRVQHQFLHAGDEQGLLKYVSEQRNRRNARLGDAHRLNLFLQLAGDISGVQLHTPNHQRRREIYERLTAMGWNEEDMLFEGGLASTWDSLVSGSRSPTSDGWSRLLSELTSILNLNRANHAQRIKLKQAQARNQHLLDLLTHLRRTTHPFGQIIEAVGIDFSRPLETFPDPFQGSCTVLQNPFPRFNEIVNWECVNDIWTGDLDHAELGQLFNERRTQIADAVNEWRIRTERHLIEEYQQGDQGGEVNVVLTVKGNTDITDNLALDTRFLLRADTVFRLKSEAHTTAAFAHFYPGLAYMHRSMKLRYYGLYGYQSQNALSDSNIMRAHDFERHPEAQTISKAILNELGLPNATHFELFAIGERFSCGRCPSTNHSWITIIEHYLEELRNWDLQHSDSKASSMCHPIIHHNIHELGLPHNPEQLVRILSEGEKQTTQRGTNVAQEACLLCAFTEYTSCWFPSNHIMTAHQRDVHGITSPMKGLHYGARDLSSEAWLAKWDAFHDNQATVPTSLSERN